MFITKKRIKKEKERKNMEKQSWLQTDSQIAVSVDLLDLKRGQCTIWCSRITTGNRNRQIWITNNSIR